MRIKLYFYERKKIDARSTYLNFKSGKKKVTF